MLLRGRPAEAHLPRDLRCADALAGVPDELQDGLVDADTLHPGGWKSSTTSTEIMSTPPEHRPRTLGGWVHFSGATAGSWNFSPRVRSWWFRIPRAPPPPTEPEVAPVPARAQRRMPVWPRE